MAVTLIATVVALVLGHLAPSLAASVRQFGWYGDWLRWLNARFPEGSFWRGRWGIAIALIPPLLVVALFQRALDGPMLGLASLLFGIVVLFYAWGPRDLDLDVDAIAEAQDPLSRRDAAAKLWPEGELPRLDGGSLVEAVFRNALRRWFGVLFWFLLLGPFGALLYRLAALSVEGAAARGLPRDTAAGARTLLAILEWPVAQLMALSTALVGNFDTALGAWRDAGGSTLSLDHRFLGAVARASVRSELAEEAAEYGNGASGETDAGLSTPALLSAPGELPELRDAMSLIWRSLLVWLAVLALFVIAGFVS
ncbi:MAG: regulatory signaling modulator protein AmpE [Pseudomonadota bacterium]|nr:regulatory signaling modulator protein AmpE [Pseudomonadota bacterium]